ncbi:MAG: ATP-dependent RecD-like DNA helicase [Candidatus Methanomethylicaceae archaeon]
MMSEELTFEVESIVHKTKNSLGRIFAVLRVVLDDGRRVPVVINGEFKEEQIARGSRLVGVGEWDEHHKYGRRFKCYAFFPESGIGAEETVRFLEQFAPGIGPVKAKRIVKTLGDDCFLKIRKSPEVLETVDGLTNRDRESVINAVTNSAALRLLVAKLSTLGVTPGYAARIVKHFGSGAVNIVESNPYRLTEVNLIGFKTADAVALRNGIKLEDPTRVRFGIIYVMDKVVESGSTFVKVDELAELSRKELGVNQKLLDESIKNLIDDGILLPDRHGMGCVALKQYAFYEEEVARRLIELSRSGGVLKSGSIPFDIDNLIKEAMGNVVLSEEQKNVALDALRNGVTVLTGGPGTGKTTTIRALYTLAKSLGIKVMMCAPTGRASKRINEVCGSDEAKTIHRLLEYYYDETTGRHGFGRSEANPLPAGLIIVDETSMVDIALAYNLLNAVRNGSSVLFVGDADQLPPVGPGRFFLDIINSGQFPVHRLKTIFRQAKQSGIVINAHLVNAGRMPTIKTPKQDFIFVDMDDPKQIHKFIVEGVVYHMLEVYDDPIYGVQVLCPMKNGVIGAKAINEAIRNILIRKGIVRSDKGSIQVGQNEYSVGDRIIQHHNNYKLMAFNGDIGIIRSVDVESQTAVVDFGDREVSYGYEDLKDVAHAYAITVHKSQGSEYGTVVMPVHTTNYIMLQRNLLYTGITRAKKMCVLVGNKKSVAIAVKNDKPIKRTTMLTEEIISLSRRDLQKEGECLKFSLSRI